MRGVRTVRALYPRLAIAPDFVQASIHWVDSATFDGMRLAAAPPMVIGFDGLPQLPSVRCRPTPRQPSQPPNAAPALTFALFTRTHVVRQEATDDADPSVYQGVRYTARVLLRASAVSAPPAPPPTEADLLDPLKRLRFVVLRDKAKTLSLPGGSWSADLDGGNPARGDDALIRTAM